MTTDTSERGLERLICAALAGHPCEPPATATVGEPPAGYGGVGWSGGNFHDYDREYCVDPAQLAAFLHATQPEAAESLALYDDGPTRRRFIETGKKIIISTVQKFPYILDEIGNEQRARSFAIIIDEAHSSQGGKTSAAMAQALSETGEAEEEETFEDQINRLMESRKLLSDASYFAFTATPKNKTLEIFGDPDPQPDGNARLNSDRENARIEHDKALLRVMASIMNDDTTLFRQFMDNESFKRHLSDWSFGIAYEQAATR